jgi:hypothetical protein
MEVRDDMVGHQIHLRLATQQQDGTGMTFRHFKSGLTIEMEPVDS